MKRMLINASQPEELRVALIDNNSLYDLIIQREGCEQKVGNICKAKITSLENSLEAAFVDYGADRHGFLPLKEISPEYFLKKVTHGSRPDIRDILKIGQEVMIQIEKEERGNKGAALTTFISMPGSYTVLMPNNPKAGGISKRIEGEERDELKEVISQINLPENAGLIVRTAGLGKSPAEIQWDIDVRLTHWDAIKKAFESRQAPFLIHREGDIITRAIRDYFRSDIEELLIDDEETYKKALNYIQQVRPEFVDRVKFYQETEHLFTHFEIEKQIETAYKRTVHLPAGGSIVIDHTEALVAIDINSAGSTKGHNIEQTALSTNLEAAEEIGRQVRLRDIGGLIVIDFIDMMESKHQRDVENALLNSLRLDRARVQTSRISRFGLLEMSRQRLRPSLRETIQNICPTCDGHGSVRTIESIVLSILRIINEEAMKQNTGEIQVQASAEIATYILNEKRSFIRNIEEKHDVTIFIIPNPNLQAHNYIFKRLRRTDSETSQRHRSSYQHLKDHNVDSTRAKSGDRRQNQPAVQSLLPTRPDLSSDSNGLIKRLWSSMFGPVDDEEESGGSSGSRTQTQAPRKTDSSRSTRPQRSQGQSQRKESTQRSRQNKPRQSTSDRKPTDNKKRGRPPKSSDIESTYKEYTETPETKPASKDAAKPKRQPPKRKPAAPKAAAKPKSEKPPAKPPAEPLPKPTIVPTEPLLGEPLVVRPKSDKAEKEKKAKES